MILGDFQGQVFIVQVCSSE